MPSLLIVSYWYPPAVGAAAQRIHAFARYLPARGWDVHVLTADRPMTPLDGGVTLVPADDPVAEEGVVFADYDPRVRAGRLASALRDLVFPDRFVHWHKAAIRAGLAAARGRQFDAMLVSFPPASAVMVALALRRRTAIPMVLDVRDRWLGPGGYDPRSPGARRRHETLEREAIESASAVVTVSEALADAIAIEHRKPRDRVWVVPNGFDPVISLPSEVARKHSFSIASANPPFTIAHVGTVIHRNRPDLFLNSLRGLHHLGALAGLRFLFVGNLSRDYIDSLGLSDVVQTTGIVPREAAAKCMQSADALLLLTGDYVAQWGYSAKLFEYLHTGRPILCVEESGGSNDRALLESQAPDRCAFAAMTDQDDILAALKVVRGLAAARQPNPPLPELEQFSRPRLASVLAERLSGLVNTLSAAQ